MTELSYRIVNVFARDGGRLTGNPLCVFEDARELDAEVMQQLALQFNLSETTFLLSVAGCSLCAVRCRGAMKSHKENMSAGLRHCICT